MRIAKVCSGNVGVAVVSFVISILLLKTHGQEIFAVFSIFLVFSSIHLSIVNSAFLVPASRIENISEKDSFIRDCSAYFYVVSGMFSILYALFLFLSNVSYELLLPFSCLYFFYVVRGYVRAYAFVVQEYNKSLVSDVFFSVLSLLIITPSLLFFEISVTDFCLIFSFLCLVSLCPFGSDYLNNFRFKFNALRIFVEKHSDKISESKHSITGVFYSEIVSNSHAYAIPLIFGIKNYAPIAAFFMLFRPFAIAASSFIQSERVPLIKSTRDGKSISPHLWRLTKISFLLFIGNFFVAIAILFFQKEFLLSIELVTVFLICALIIFSRNIKSILSLGLQVKGFFQLVTFISSKYVLLIPIFLLISWQTEYTYSMIFFTVVVEVVMLCDFYLKYRSSC